MALGVAKALLCKNRFDSFQAAEADGSSDSMICKWRADSFADLEPTVETLQQRQHIKADDRRQRIRQESAVLEALARQRGPEKPTGSFEACAPRSRLDKPPSRGGRRDEEPQKGSSPDCDDEMTGRLEAMEMASREAAIREHLQQEMNSACAPGATMQLPMPTASFQMSPARARGRGQPGQRQPGQRSSSRSSLPAKSHQPLVATATARNDSFRQTVDAVKIAANETFQKAESFRQAALSPRPRRNSFGTTSSFGRLQSFVAEPQSPMRRPSSFSFGQLAATDPPQAGPSSPCSSRASSFSMSAVVMSRNNSFSNLLTSTATAGSQPRSVARSGSYAPPAIAVPSLSAMQRVASVVEEQAQLAARLNTAAEMIDNIVMDNSVLDEAKRITEEARKQQVRRQQQQQQRRASPSPPPTFTNRQAQTPSRARSSSIFWRPPPEAVQICARCPSIESVSLSNGRSDGRTSASRFGAPPPSSRGIHITV